MKRSLVLSIQSHVVHGRVGNRCASLSLELNGVDIDPLNTVQLCTNGAYPHVKGTVLTAGEFKAILEGLELNNLTECYTHLLTGHIKNPDIIKAIGEFRKKLGDKVCYFCDPVLGDNGKMYMTEECFLAMKEYLVPQANLITPNAYEAMWLTGKTMANQKELLEITQSLHELGPEGVVITSTEWKRRFTFFSFENGKHQLVIEIPSIERKFDGPGDLFTGLLLANYINFTGDYVNIAERTLNSVFAVLAKTNEMESREMVLTKCIQELLNPPMVFKVMPMDEFMKLDLE